MKDTAQEKQPPLTAPAAQRETQERGGHLSTQLASSPRQAAQRRLIGQTLGSAVQRVEGELDEEEGGAAQLRSEPVQREAGGLDEEEEPPAAAQLRAEPAQRQENRTGMPDGLKAGIESLSGMDMSDVRVHRNSSQPAQLNALAYAQGNDIHLGPGQEQHLPHEAWHVVQQRQGRVQATMQMAGVGVNDDEGLEREADVMGGRAVQMRRDNAQRAFSARLNPWSPPVESKPYPWHSAAAQQLIQRRLIVGVKEVEFDTALQELTSLNRKELSEDQKELLRAWVTEKGPRTLLGHRISSGRDKKYQDYEEVLAAINGEISAKSNLKKETELARLIPKNDTLRRELSDLSRKIFKFIEENKKSGNLSSNQEKKQGEFWSAASGSYRGLWNFIGPLYNIKRILTYISYLSPILVFALFRTTPLKLRLAIMAAIFPLPRVTTGRWTPGSFQDTLSRPSGNIVDLFASIKQTSNVYSERMGKQVFRTPKLEKVEDKLSLAEGDEYVSHDSEKRHNTQSLNEKDDWTVYARQQGIPVSAGASGSMDRMYRLAKDAGASDLQLIALALAGHFVFNQQYTWFSRDPHTFFEIMDVIHPYLSVKPPKKYDELIGYFEEKLNNGFLKQSSQ